MPEDEAPDATDEAGAGDAPDESQEEAGLLTRFKRTKSDDAKSWTPSPEWSSQTKLAIAVALVIGALWAMYLARNIITLAALAGLIAFLISPVIRMLHERFHVPRGLALLGSYIFVFVALLFIGALVLDGMYGAVQEIDPNAAADSLRTDTVSWLEGIRQVSLFSYTVESRSIYPGVFCTHMSCIISNTN